MAIKKYGVVVCSDCKRAWGADLMQKTTKCPICGKKYRLASRKILYQTSNIQELQLAISKIQENLVK
jgi:hypothetical protein